MTEDMSFQLSLENCQGLSIPDGGGKFIPSARNGDYKSYRKIENVKVQNVSCDV